MDEQLNNPGALLDLRSEEEKAKDYKFGEIVSAVEPVVWVEKPRSEWRKFPIFNQDGSGSCVAQTLRKLYGVYIWLKTGFYVDISASHIYQRRINKPAPGMGGTDVFTIGQKGTTLNSFAPSDMMTDAQMDAVQVLPFMEEIGKVFKLGAYVVVSPTDIDTIASIIQKTKKAVMTWYYFNNSGEWTIVPTVKDPNLNVSAPSTNRHSVAAVDYTLLGKTNMPEYPQVWGKKALIVDESWGLGTALNGQRVITEDFFKARNFFAAHFQNFAFETPVTKPSYDGSVVSLQDCLKHYGTFPSNVASTGVFGPITQKAVSLFQVQEGLHPTGTGAVGPLTKARLLELYP